jgi:replicative DNA helicase
MIDELLLYSTEAEQAVLGILLIEPDLIKDCKIRPFHLSPGVHHNLLWTMLDLDSKGIPIDLISILERVGKTKLEQVGGISYLSKLGQAIPTTANLSYYEKVIFEYWQRRETVKLANKLKESAIEESPSNAIQSAISELLQLDDDTTNDDGSIKNELVELYEDFENPKGDITGIPTGYTELDQITSGLQKQDLIIIAARPSVGKTAFCLNIADGVARQENYAVGIFSLEMSRKQLLKRMIASNGRIYSQSIRKNRISGNEWNKLSLAMGEVGNMNLRIFDKPGITVNEIWAKVRKMKREFEGKDLVIIIDYLQLIVGSEKHRGNRTQEISEISRTLKHLARELDVCVIALSQLSRAVEQRQDKRPMMSDIRESGQIEQDADVIGFLYRDDYYDKESENKNIIEIIVAKQRNGPTGTVQLAFIKEYGVFLNLETRQMEGRQEA